MMKKSSFLCTIVCAGFLSLAACGKAHQEKKEVLPQGTIDQKPTPTPTPEATPLADLPYIFNPKSPVNAADSVNPFPTSIQTPSPAPAGTFNSTSSLSINGTYSSECSFIEESLNTKKTTFVASGTSFTLEVHFFSGKNCQENAKSSKYTFSGQVIPPGKGVIGFTALVNQIFASAHTSATALKFNNNKFCGNMHWSVGMPMDITFADCSLSGVAWNVLKEEKIVGLKFTKESVHVNDLVLFKK